MSRKRVVIAFGTRPEAIKMAPVVQRLSEYVCFDVRVVVTGQHREMLDQVLRLFEIEPDANLDVMSHKQSLDDLTMRVLAGMGSILDQLRPDAVLVQGDTTTTFATALSAFYRKISVGHIEAGLRTSDRYNPFPEEVNRRLTTALATWHFAPTEVAHRTLLDEGIDPAAVWNTGNTVIDALLEVSSKPFSFEPGPIADALASGRRIILVTAHRRENWGARMRQICEAVRCLAGAHADAQVMFSVHLNPETQAVAHEVLGTTDRVTLLPPVDYLSFVNLMKAATLILSDSGGMQEEAPSFGKPVLVLRDTTERPEAVASGCVRLVGTRPQDIVREASRLLNDGEAYAAMAQASNPFGDGRAAERIAQVLAGALECETAPK